MTWASAAVPTPAGVIDVRAGAAGITVIIPAGLTLVRDGARHDGPATISLPSR
ncbi:MAG: hypothetical protein WDO13_20215 [Verrucomicrobiota bacterium]